MSFDLGTVAAVDGTGSRSENTGEDKDGRQLHRNCRIKKRRWGLGRSVGVASIGGKEDRRKEEQSSAGVSWCGSASTICTISRFMPYGVRMKLNHVRRRRIFLVDPYI